MIAQLYKQLVNCGCQESLSEEKNIQIRINNQISLLLPIVGVPYIFLFNYMGLPIPTLLVIPSVFSLYCCIALNCLRLYNASQILMIIFPSVVILYYASILGKSAHAQLIYFAQLCSIIVFFFEHKTRKMKKVFIYSLIPISCLLLLELTDYSLFPAYNLKPSYIKLLSLFGIITVTVIIFSCIAYFIHGINKLEHKMEQMNNDLLKSKLVQEDMAKHAAYALLLKNISHELKNPMNMISLGVQSIALNLNDKQKAKTGCELTLKNVQRLKNILHTMLKFGTEGVPERSLIALNKVIESVILMSHLFLDEKNIKVVKQLHDIPDIYANEHQIHQIIMNIVVNACEAMTGGGTLAFETDTASFFSQNSSTRVKGVYFKISDTGSGISEENLKKIFDPFFTTKHNNSGLGLSLTMKMIAAHGGFPHVESEIGKGTHFTVTLPLTHDAAAQEETGQPSKIAASGTGYLKSA